MVGIFKIYECWVQDRLIHDAVWCSVVQQAIFRNFPYVFIYYKFSGGDRIPLIKENLQNNSCGITIICFISEQEKLFRDFAHSTISNVLAFSPPACKPRDL